MRQFINALSIFYTFVYATLAWSQSDWRPIAPLDYCSKFTIEYQITSDGEYKVRIPGPSGPKLLDQKLADINDLSSLTDILVEESTKVCSQGFELIVDGNYLVLEEPENQNASDCRQKITYTEPYLDLTREMISILQYEGNRCDQLLAYTKLQTKISELSDEELIELETPSSLGHVFIKMFKGDETDKMVDLYTTCGGEKFSDKFVTNLILIETKNSCMMPRPPGIFDFEQVKAIAEDIAKDYNGLGLLDINDKKAEITKRAVQTLSKKALKIEIENLLGPELVDSEGFAQNLEALQLLEKADYEELDPDFLSLGFSFEATMEVAKKALPLIAKSSFQDKFPETWSEDKKSAYFEKEFLPKVENDYAACMSEHYKKSALDLSIPLNKRLKARSKLKGEYCKNHPEQCAGKSCDESVNILSQDPTITDSSVVQGCVMQAMVRAVKPTIKLGISAQLPSFENDFSMSEQELDALTQEGYEELLFCANNKIMEVSDEDAFSETRDNSPPILSSPKYLQKISAGQFENVILECANVAETKIAKDFFKRTLLGQDALAQNYPKNEEGKLALHNEVSSILDSTYSPCIERQLEESDGKLAARNPMLCIPIVEMAAAKTIIKTTLQKTFKEENVLNTRASRFALMDFDNCASKTIDNSLDAIAQSEDDTNYPIATNEDAEAYLEKNPAFYQCVKQGILTSTEIIGSKVYDESTSEMKSELSDPEYLDRLKDPALAIIKSCFSKELDKLGTWGGFTAFNEKDGLTQLQNQCTEKVMDYVLPKTLVTESKSQLLPLIEEGFLSGNEEVVNTLAQTALELRKRYKLKAPSDLKGQELVEWSFANAHNAHLRSQDTKLDDKSSQKSSKGLKNKESAKTQKDTESFVNEYTEVIMDKAITSIHRNTRKKLSEISEENYDDFFNALTPQCLQQIYTGYNKEIMAFTEKLEEQADPNTDSAPLSDEIAQMLLTGLTYQKQLGDMEYRLKVEEIKRTCQNLSYYKDPAQLAKTGVFDFFFKGIIRDTVYESFDKVVSEQCLDDLGKYLDAESSQRICMERDPAKGDKIITELLKSAKTIKDPSRNRAILFAGKRHLDMIKLLNKKLKNARALEATLFKDDDQILNQIYENFTGIVLEDKEIMLSLEKTIVEKLFANRESESFADDFSKIQISSGLGLSGYEQANDAVNLKTVRKSVGFWEDIIVNKDKVVKVGKEGLQKAWVPTTLERYLDWKGIDPKQRKKLINSLYENAITPSILGSEPDNDKIAQDVGKHASEYRYSDNKTFEDRITKFINDYVLDEKTSILGIED